MVRLVEASATILDVSRGFAGPRWRWVSGIDRVAALVLGHLSMEHAVGKRWREKA